MKNPYLPNLDPGNLQPHERRIAFGSEINGLDLREDLPTKVMGWLLPGDKFRWQASGEPEAFVQAWSTTADRIQTCHTTDYNGYESARAAGIVEDHRQFIDRSVVAIAIGSSPVESTLFVYDVETGKRYWPNPERDIPDSDSWVALGQMSVGQIEH